MKITRYWPPFGRDIKTMPEKDRQKWLALSPKQQLKKNAKAKKAA